MLTEISERILDIFKKHRIPANGLLYERHITSCTSLWDEEEKDAFADEVKNLTELGYVNKDDTVYRLTQAGYDFLYRHLSMDDTIHLILSDFRKRRIGTNDILLLPALLATLQDAERYHFDHYDKAIRILVNRGWIIANGRGFILTDEGYREVFPS